MSKKDKQELRQQIVCEWLEQNYLKDEVVNHTALVLVGRQGIFKTMWHDRLMHTPLVEALESK